MNTIKKRNRDTSDIKERFEIFMDAVADLEVLTPKLNALEELCASYAFSKDELHNLRAQAEFLENTIRTAVDFLYAAIDEQIENAAQHLKDR